MTKNEQPRHEYLNIASNTETHRDYRVVNREDPTEEPIIMLKIRKEIKEVSNRQKRNQTISRYFAVFFLGVFFGLVVFLLWNGLWNYVSRPTKNTNSTCPKRVIGYYSGWESRKITEKQIEKLTHIIFDGTEITANGTIVFQSNEKKSLFLDMKMKANAMKSEVKIMFSTDAYYSTSDILIPVMNSSNIRKAVINSISIFIVEHQLDGVDLPWRRPKTKEDLENYYFFIRDLRYHLDNMKKYANRAYLISVLSSYFGEPVWHGTNWQEHLEFVDFLNIETDKYYRTWHSNDIIGPLSPLYSTEGENYQKSVNFTLHTYSCKTKMPSRLNMVIPFRGVHWENVKNPVIGSDELYQHAESINGEPERSYISWRNFEKEVNKTTSISWHNDSKTPYIWDSKNRKLLTFDNERSLREKMKYAVDKNIGGVAIWRIEYDDDENTLLNAMTSVDMCSGEQFEKDQMKYTCEIAEPESSISKNSKSQNYLFVFYFDCFLLFLYITLFL